MFRQRPGEKTMIDVLLRKYIEENILPLYDGFDGAHQRNHAEAVIGESLRLAGYYEVDGNMVYAIAAYHDVGLVESRETHHLVSARMLLADEMLRNWFSESQLGVMAEAVEDHRASSARTPRSLYGKIVAEADRQIDPENIIHRTVLFGLSHYPEVDKEGQYQRAVCHMNEKYAEGGYMRLWIPQSPNAVRLEELRRIIHDEERFRKLFERFYSEYVADR